MAIDKGETEKLLKEIDELFEAVTAGLDPKQRNDIKEKIMGPALKEIQNFIMESRPPKMYLIGRSGHGKSSLINALAGKKVAEVGDVKPTTLKSEEYLITFEEAYSTWKVIDARGLFESTSPDGGPPADVVQMVINDLKKYKPDIVIHVISAPEVRNLANDLLTFKKIMDSFKREINVEIPTIVVLTKVDTLGNPREWPPEKFPKNAGLIDNTLKYLADEVLKVEVETISNFPYKGYRVKGNNFYLAIIPVCVLEGEGNQWNIETLIEFIGNELPESAKLQFFQALRRKELLRKLSDSIIKRFALIAFGIGAIPIPISDIIILTPLQLIMIAIIGGLSCRKFSTETAAEFLSASGVAIGAGFGLRYLARQLVKLIPGLGWAVSGAIAATGTYAIGKSAEAYFFYGEIKKPQEFENAKEIQDILKLEKRG